MIEQNIICLEDIDHVIWDYNGTMLNDVDLCVEVINLVLSRRNLNQISKSEYMQAFDFPVKDYYERIGFDFSKESFEIIGTEFIEEYNLRSESCNLHPELLNTLEKIKLIGIKQSVLSARLNDSLIEELENFKIIDFFENVSGLKDHYANGKLKIGRRLIEKIAVDPKRILFIGDTLHDLELAIDLGCRALLISNGHHTFERLKEKSKNVIHSLEEFYIVLKREECLKIG